MKVYIGEGVAKLIEERLRGAKKEVLVVSPWIGKRFLRILDELRRKGVDVRVVTGWDERNRTFLGGVMERSISFYGIVSLVSVPLSLVLFISGVEAWWVGLIGLVGLIRFWRVKLPSYIRIREALHAKIYLVDGDVLLSSANLTEGGMRNLEFVAECKVEIDTIEKIWREGREMKEYAPII